MNTRKRIRSLAESEEGSAIVEFIILALPLFIPLAIFLTSISESSSIQYQARTFAREVARVYVTSNTESDVGPRLTSLTNSFQREIFSKEKIISPPEISVSCSLSPCLTPNSNILVSVVLRSSNGHSIGRANVSEVVDSWKNSP